MADVPRNIWQANEHRQQLKRLINCTKNKLIEIRLRLGLGLVHLPLLPKWSEHCGRAEKCKAKQSVDVEH